jgi:hypothetical protein
MMVQARPRAVQLGQALARRLGPTFPGFFSRRLSPPLLVLGFNNSGKSTIVRNFQLGGDCLLYPGEGNAELWFPGFFPWIESAASFPPIWYDPERFISEVLGRRNDDFRNARAHLAVYQIAMGGKTVIVESGMLAALARHLPQILPESRIVHVLRDGRIASYITARLEWAKMLKSPARYREAGCELDFPSVLDRMARYWAWTVEGLDALHAAEPGRVMELRHETWCQDPTGEERRLRAFCGCSPSENGAGRSQDTGSYVEMSNFILDLISSQEMEIIESAAGRTLASKDYLE